MKTLKIIIAIIALTFTTQLKAQSMAVGPINTYMVNMHSGTASRLVRMELIQTEKYMVLDEFDMHEIENPETYDECFSKQCLVEYGKKLNVELIVSGSIDKIGNKIIVSLKMIDVNSGEAMRTVSDQFNDMESEIQRMIRIMTVQLTGGEPDAEIYKQLKYRNEVITSNNVGTVKNSGPRMGLGLAYGNLSEFLTRPKSRGGLDIVPVMSNLGYQFEFQYVGTDKFSALFEFIPSLNGLEQGQFLPSVNLMNGFRFGQAGWEFAFGPSFGLKRNSYGVFDTKGVFDSDNPGQYWSQSDMSEAGIYWQNGALEEHGYYLDEHLDKRGYIKLSNRWIMAAGRTFKAGALNIPVNVFYSASKKGGLVGLSMGFNITRSKEKVN